MANWVKGKLKIRGKPEDIKRWVEECLHCYFTKWFRDGSYEDELVDDAVDLNMIRKPARCVWIRSRTLISKERKETLLKRGSTGILTEKMKSRSLL